MQPHIRVSILWPLLATAAFASGFHSFTSGPWAEIFSAIGLQPGAPESARVVVLGPGAGASAGWAQRVEQGALLILEGESPVAESFGFRGGSQRVRVAGITDARRPKLPIIWREPLELPRFSTPP
ncbi:MAG: hypothetical protein HY013_16635 [Candidatus Solibacter usitatus]|nr:hypothetical protein [Candidatus Solibacter usitatus]